MHCTYAIRVHAPLCLNGKKFFTTILPFFPTHIHNKYTYMRMEEEGAFALKRIIFFDCITKKKNVLFLGVSRSYF